MDVLRKNNPGQSLDGFFLYFSLGEIMNILRFRMVLEAIRLKNMRAPQICLFPKRATVL